MRKHYFTPNPTFLVRWSSYKKRTIKDSELNTLVKGCIKGNRDARKTLYDKYSGQMLSVCYRYARSKEDAEEIFQQAFYLIYKNIGQLQNYQALSGWVKQIFVNTALQYIKQKQKIYVLENWQSEGLEHSEVNNALSILETKELIELIQKLPNGCREVFNMYVVEGYSHKEISEKLGIAVGTSKSQLHDARKILMRAIQKNEVKLNRKIS